MTNTKKNNNKKSTNMIGFLAPALLCGVLFGLMLQLTYGTNNQNEIQLYCTICCWGSVLFMCCSDFCIEYCEFDCVAETCGDCACINCDHVYCPISDECFRNCFICVGTICLWMGCDKCFGKGSSSGSNGGGNNRGGDHSEEIQMVQEYNNGGNQVGFGGGEYYEGYGGECHHGDQGGGDC